MKKLMLMGAFLLSVGVFAQSVDTNSTFAAFKKQGYVQVDATTMFNPVRECWIGIVYSCDENGNPKDPWDHDDVVSIIVTAYTQGGIADKQREYCETGTIKVLRDCEGIN